MLLLTLRCGVVAGFAASAARLDIDVGYILLLTLLASGAFVRLTSMALLCAIVLFVARTPLIWELTRPRPLQMATCLAGCLLILLANGAGRFSIDQLLYRRRQSLLHRG